MKILKILGGIFGVLIIALGGLLYWASKSTNKTLNTKRYFAPIPLNEKGDVATGERIATIRNGCQDCHGKDYSGHRVVDDPLMGKIWAPNITPAALGKWTDQDIAQAIRNGVYRDGRPLVLMPAQDYQLLSIEDLSAVVAFLRTLPPVQKDTPPTILGPLGNLFWALGKMPTLIPAHGVIKDDQVYVVKPPEGPTAEFGRYLMNNSCTGCHGLELVGGKIPGGPPDWPPAANLRELGRRGWKFEQFEKAMREGVTPEGKAIRMPMPISATKLMTDDELRALWAHLETLDKMPQLRN